MGLAMRWCMILLVVVGLCSAQYDEPVCEDLLEGARLGLGTMVKLLLGKETLQMEYQQSRDDLQRQIHVTLVNLLQLLADVPDAHSYDSPSQYATLPLSFYPNPLSTPLPSRPPITPSPYRPSTTTSSYRTSTTPSPYRPPTTPSPYKPPTPSSSYRPRTTPSYSKTTLSPPVYPVTSTRNRPKYFGYGTTSTYTIETPQELPGYKL